jgi:anti-anti-sigma regulatory factor
METSDVAFPVRPGEHACCRPEHPQDRERLAAAFVRAGLGRGHKVVFLCPRPEVDETRARLRASDRDAASALERGQLEIRDMAGTYTPDGTFDVDRMMEALRDEHARALAQGYAGLSLTGDVGAAVSGAPGAERLPEYERRLDDELGRGTHVLLCRYDHARVDPRTLSDAVAVHHVDVSPELAPVGRTGVLAAARVHRPETLRLAGELDFESAGILAEVLDAHFGGPLRLDLADLSFVDVSGLRMLCQSAGPGLTIAAASAPVRRIVGLLGWDTDPAIELTA